MGQLYISKKVDFDAAHFLPYHSGKCHKMHGHRWTVEIMVTRSINEIPDGPEKGMVVDYSVLKNFLNKYVVGKLDHRVINDVLFNPTAENISEYIAEQWYIFAAIGLHNDIKLAAVKVWETPDSKAIWMNEPEIDRGNNSLNMIEGEIK